jgi:hypothetical protein
MSSKFISYLFYLAGIINILGTLIFSKFFTNNNLTEIDPLVMSKFGLIMIMVWGLAFISIAKKFYENKFIIAVFSLEKLAYVIAWCLWYFNKNYSLESIFQKDFLAGTFYSLYGLNDLFFLLLFLYVLTKKSKKI